MTAVDSGELAQLVAARRWYHTLELPGGIVTPGEYDLRSALGRVPLPASLAGKRCLDVGTHDGFWAFEMERRGAAEVVAIDLDDPTRYDWPAPAPELGPNILEDQAARREAFTIAHRALGSRVERRFISVYELTADELGEFDFATIGTLLLHLRDPVGALIGIRRVLRGELLCNDVVQLLASLLRPRTPVAELIVRPGVPIWWAPNVAGLQRYVRAAGYEIVKSGRPYLIANGAGRVLPPMRENGRIAPKPLRRLMLRLGVPHAWILARPVH